MRGNGGPSALTGVPGWETPDEEEVLCQYAGKVMSGGVIAEIGSEFGMSAAAFAVTTAGLPEPPRIFSIDIRFDGEIGDIFSENLNEIKMHHRITKLVGDSHVDATKELLIKAMDPAKKLDLLFVDGDHSVEGALQDLKMYAPLVRVGGWLLVHDVAQTTNKLPHHLHFDVTQALTRWLWEEKQGPAWKMVDQVNTLAVFERRK